MIAYLTHDDVNAATARELAARLGFHLTVLDVRLTEPGAARLVCDLDHLPVSVKADLLANARSGVNLSSVGAHSYHFTDEELGLLRAAGASAGQRLSERLFVVPVPRRTAVAA